MYGKIFEEIFDSTIIQHGGDVLYVFMSMIVLSDKDGILKFSATALAHRILKDLKTVEDAILKLNTPDPNSNSKDFEGRRIIPLSEISNGEENRGWVVVNKIKYKEKASKYDSRTNTRERVRKFRLKCNDDVTQCNAMKRCGNASFGHTDTDTDINTMSEFFDVHHYFEEEWQQYPNRVGKKEAFRHFQASVKNGKDLDSFRLARENYLKHLKNPKNSWKKPQNGSTFFNNWQDWVNWVEPVILQKREVVV